MKIKNYQLKDILNEIIEISALAGKAILTVYQSDDFDVETKGDESPLTRADLAAHHIIVKALSEQFPTIPCLSEESNEISFEERSQWDTYFIVDPLDGTKEFIARNGEFTVNIALVQNGKPLLGVVYAPVLETTYYAAKDMGAYKMISNNAANKITVRAIQNIEGKNHFTVVASRRHGLDKVEKLCQNFESYDLTSKGSSLKMCLVAEGRADFYPRLAPTSEWDTAAAQAIVEEAGGRIVKLDFTDLNYNQKECILNPFFMVLGDNQYDWKAELVIEE